MAFLTRENCQEILQKYSSDEYDTNFSFCLKPSERHNILKMKFNPKISNSRPQFFVKTPDNNPVPSLITKNYNSNKEASFYQYFDLIQENQDTPKSVIPNIYYADKKTNTLVLEDLSKNDYRKCGTKQFDENHVKIAIASLAKFHSISIIHDQKSKEALDGEIRKSATEESLFGNITDDALQLLIKHILKEVVSLEDNYQSKLFQEYNKMIQDFTMDTPGINVCCHGDLFSDNILFQYQQNDNVPTHCKFIDFAFARYKSPAHDLTMLLYTCVDPKLRQAKYNCFLKYYYAQLKTILTKHNLLVEDILPVSEYELSCKKYMRYARMIVALYKVIHNSCQETKERCKNYTRKYTIQADLSIAIDNTIVSIEDIHLIVQSKINTTDYDLEQFILKPVDVKSGFLGEHLNLTVIIVRATGITHILKYFVKALPELKSQRDFAIETGGIFKETSWFSRLIPDYIKNGINIMNKCIPNCYLARDNDVFVFEDLKEAGYGMISVRNPLDLNGMKHAIASLAKYHAAPLILEEMKSKKLGRNYRLPEDYAKEFEETFYSGNKHSMDLIRAATNGTPTYVDLVPIPKESAISREEIIKMEREFVREFRSDVQPSTQFRNSICHGDLWTANIMFRKENDIVNDAKLVDFQSYRYGPPAQDLLAMIYMTTDRALRKQHMTSLTSYYYEELGKNVTAYNLDIKDIIPAEEFQKSLQHYEKFAVVQASTHMQVVTMSEETIKIFFEDNERCQKFLFVDRTDNIIKCCNEDPVYKRIQEGTLADLRELCEKLKPNFKF